jgi:hypothetical protein
MPHRRPEAPLSTRDAQSLERHAIDVLRALGVIPAADSGVPDRRTPDPEQEVTSPGFRLRSR